MNPLELTRALERGSVLNASFHHESHLRVAWVCLQESDTLAEAITKMGRTLRDFTTAAGKPEKYHETITVFWIRVLAALRDVTGECDLDKILRTHPHLLKKDFLLDYYSQDLLSSDRARKSWIEPDRKPLCFHATPIYSSSSTGDAPHRVVCG